MFSNLLLTAMLSVALALPNQNPISTLSWDVYLQPQQLTGYDTPGHPTWSPTAFTLIHGPSSAILVDAPVTNITASTLADWISATIPNKTLTHVYVTHGHGDHFFGLPILQQRFPGLKAIATPQTIAHIQQQIAPPSFIGFWNELFPNGQIPAQDEIFEAVNQDGKIELDGHYLEVVQVGQTDTWNTTVLHIPELEMVVTGDAVYGECFQYFVDTDTNALRKQWLDAIVEIEGLRPKIVVPSHKQAWDGFGVDHLEKTKDYILTWEQEIAVASNETDLEARIKAAYPQRIGETILGLSAASVFA